MSTPSKWITLVIGAIAAFGAVYAQGGGIGPALTAAAAFVIAHLLPSPLASQSPPPK